MTWHGLQQHKYDYVRFPKAGGNTGNIYFAELSTVLNSFIIRVITILKK